MKETKNATIRLDKDVYDYITKNGKSINQAINDVLEEVQTIRKVSLAELRGVFTPSEWKFLADSLNGSMIEDFTRYRADLLIMHCEDAVLYDKLDTKWGVDMEEFKKKLNTLHGANVSALYDRIESFWNGEDIDFDDWAKF